MYLMGSWGIYATVKEYLTVQTEGGRQVTPPVTPYKVAQYAQK